jgi:predicted SAM-dependent methyltransferase
MFATDKIIRFARKPLPEKRAAMSATFRALARGQSYRSETSKCRARLGKFCSGYGLDLGPGGDPINDTAIRVDLVVPYARTGKFGVQLGGDASRLDWFRDGTLDYVFSSHLLEDFANTKEVLREWLRVLKPGGKLVLFCPDEQMYQAYCRKIGVQPNQNHQHANFSLRRVRDIILSFDPTPSIIHENPLVDSYSWELVVQKSRMHQKHSALQKK